MKQFWLDSLFFFGFHIISGERGLLARPGLELEIIQVEEQLALLNKHKRFLQQRISLLHSGSIDADILAETARSELGLYGPNDVIVSINIVHQEIIDDLQKFRRSGGNLKRAVDIKSLQNPPSPFQTSFRRRPKRHKSRLEERRSVRSLQRHRRSPLSLTVF